MFHYSRQAQIRFSFLPFFIAINLHIAFPVATKFLMSASAWNTIAWDLRSGGWDQKVPLASANAHQRVHMGGKI